MPEQQTHKSHETPPHKSAEPLPQHPAGHKDAPPEVTPHTLITLPPPSSISGPQGQAYYAETTFALNVLLSDGYQVVSREGFIASNIGVLPRGQVMNYNAGTHALALSDGNPAGTIPPNCILAQQIDTTVTPIPPGGFQCVVYVSGKVRWDALTWAPTGTYSQAVQAEALRDKGILVETVMQTSGQLVPL